MASWGAFIAEVPIVNKRAEGIFVKADHVLDLWEERNQLRAELAKLRDGGGTGAEPAEMPMAAPVAAEESTGSAALERERCARELEEFAQTCPVDPAYRELAAQLLLTAAQMLRERVQAGAEQTEPAEIGFLQDVVIPPAAQATTSEAPPPMAELVSDETPPMAEPVADEEPARPW